MRSLLVNLPVLRRVLLRSSSEQNGFSVPPAVAATITDGEVEATVKSLSPFLNLLFRSSASLETYASPLSSVIRLFAGFCIVLRGNTFPLLDDTRSVFSGFFSSRLSLYSHPVVVWAFTWTRFLCPPGSVMGRRCGGRRRCGQHWPAPWLFCIPGRRSWVAAHTRAGRLSALRGWRGRGDACGSPAPGHLVALSLRRVVNSAVRF